MRTKKEGCCPLQGNRGSCGDRGLLAWRPHLITHLHGYEWVPPGGLPRYITSSRATDPSPPLLPLSLWGVGGGIVKSHTLNIFDCPLPLEQSSSHQVLLTRDSPSFSTVPFTHRAIILVQMALIMSCTDYLNKFLVGCSSSHLQSNVTTT